MSQGRRRAVPRVWLEHQKVNRNSSVERPFWIKTTGSRVKRGAPPIAWFRFNVPLGSGQNLVGGPWIRAMPRETRRSDRIVSAARRSLDSPQFCPLVFPSAFSAGNSGLEKNSRWWPPGGNQREAQSETVLSVGADGGGRTPTTLRSQDFESSASANSATSATRVPRGFCKPAARQTCIRFSAWIGS